MAARELETVVKVDSLVQKRANRIVLNELSFELYKGECLGVLGVRDSGKSMLVHILAGVDRFHSGSVEIMGFNIRKSQDFKKHLGLVTQKGSLFKDLNLVENLDFIATLKGAEEQDIERVVARMELDEYLKEPVSRLPAGIYQRLSLACAMLTSPQLLLLDELLKDIDFYSRHLMLKELKEFVENGGSCIYAFSNIELVGLMSKVGWLDEGQMIICEPQAAREKWNKLNQF